MSCPPVIPVTASSVSDLKDVRVVLYEVLYCAAGGVVLPVGLEQGGTEHYGQVMEVHLVLLRKTLHAGTHVGKTHEHKQTYTEIQEDFNVRFSPIEVVDKGL